MAEHKGPDVSKRRRTPGGQFADEDSTNLATLPADNTGETIEETLNQLEEIEPGSPDDPLQAYDEATLDELHQQADITDQQLDEQYPIADLTKLEQAKDNALAKQHAATITLINNSRTRLAAYQAEERQALDETISRYNQQTALPKAEAAQCLIGRDHPYNYISPNYLNSLREYQTENYSQLIAPGTTFTKIEPYKYRGGQRFRITYTSQDGQTGKVTVPENVLDVTGEKHNLDMHEHELDRMRWTDQALKAGLKDPDLMRHTESGWPDYDYNGRKLDFDEDTPARRAYDKALDAGGQATEAYYDADTDNRHNHFLRQSAELRRSRARQTLAMYEQTKDMRFTRPSDSEAERKIINSMPNLPSHRECDIRGYSPDGSRYLIARHSDRYAEYVERGYKPDRIRLGVVDSQTGEPLTGDDGQPLTMDERQFLNPANR